MKALDTACTVCQSPAGQSCTYIADGTLVERRSHAERTDLAAEVRLPLTVALVAS